MENTKLRRYTTIPVLLDMLVKKKITLLDPTIWEDRNDSYYVERYKDLQKLKTVLALCFSTKVETFHHWKVFAGNSSGVCIRFNHDKLLASLNGKPGIRSDYVIYRKLKELQSWPPNVEDLPFVKRIQYEDEGEFRIIYEDRKKLCHTIDFAIDLQCVEGITLSPWLPKPITKTIKEIILSLDECSSIRMYRSGIVDNMTWKNIANRL